jgi:hypothetical protein
MNLPNSFMVFDVESVGLHGEGFAVGVVVIDRDGNERLGARLACPLFSVNGDDTGRQWVKENCPGIVFSHITHGSPRDMRHRFWEIWQSYRDGGSILVADCGWPVEARFLAACVDDDLERRFWTGPLPLHELASFRLAAGLDPTGIENRLPDELPAHDPLADARQSVRLLIEAIKILSPVTEGG